MKAVNNYLKNVMKSVAYAAADVSEQHTPGIHDFTSTNKEFINSTYAALKNPAPFLRKKVEVMQESKVYKALDYGARNLFEDLRTGNFYNKARKERDELALSGLDFGDDLSEFGIDDNWESEINSSDNKDISAGDIKIVESIEGSNAALANATVNAVIASSKNEIRNSRVNTAMIYTQNEKLFGGLHKDISILGSTMQQMYKLQFTSLQNIDKNLSEFFTQESKLNAERNAILKEILEIQRNTYTPADKKESNSKKGSKRIRWSDINTNGIIDIGEYFNAVKKNINNQISSLGLGGFNEDSNMLAEFMVSPLEGVMKYIVNGIIPATVKAATKEFDGTISGIFGNIIGELGNARSKNDGGILSIIAKFLGVSTGVNRNIDTSKYEKGVVPFDGITRKAIIDVIPTHLRRIEAAITGRPEEAFDYRNGRWIKVSDIKKQYDDIKKNSIKRATSELREHMNPGIQAIRNGILNEYERDAWDKAVEEFESFLYNNNGRFNSKVSASKNGISSVDYPNLYRHYNKIKTVFNNFDMIESKNKAGNTIIRNTKNSVRMKLSANVNDAKDYEEKQYRDAESEVGNLFQMYFGSPKADTHGKYEGKDKNSFKAFNILNNTKDDLGNTIFDYLQNINKELRYMRENGIRGNIGGISTSSNEVLSMEKINTKIKNPSLRNNNTLDRENSKRKQIYENALKNIASGKAIDLRDFDIDQQNYLLQLKTMLSNNAITEYQNEIKGYNSNAISSFIDKHFIKTNIKSQKDIEEAIKKADEEGKNTNEVMDAKEEKFFKKILNRIGVGGETVLGGIIGASSEAFTNLLYAADKAIYEMMYKTEIEDDSKKKYDGFMNAMVGKMSDKFEEIGDAFKKNIIDPFKDRFGIDDKFEDRFKDSLINTGSKLWTSFKDANMSVYGPLLEKIRPDVDYEELERQELEAKKQERKESKKYKKSVLKGFKNSDEATSKITNKNFNRAIKFGTKEWGALTTHSEEANETRRIRNLLIHSGDSEAIAIWCEKNGFTGDLDEKKVRLGSEFGLPAAALSRIQTDEDANLVFIKQFKHNAKGTPSGRPFKGLTTLTKGEVLIPANAMGTIVPKTGVYRLNRPMHIINTEDAHDFGLIDGPRVSVQQALGKEKLAAKAAGFTVAHHDKGTISINGKDLDTNEVLSEAKKFIPEAASGGLIGGILSLVLGLAGGPILGAAIGAGGSIVANSDTLKAKLFGKMGEDGKNDGSGIISKTIMDKFHKYFPDMSKYGLAGIIPGLLTPLGPIGGLLVGGAFGYLKNNENFTNKYFGENGALHIKSKEKKIIENMLPGAIKGAGIGAISSLFLPTPFGILGNAAIGSAIGMVASTEEFKNGILGQEIDGVRVGGIVNTIIDIFAPLKESMKDLGTKLVEVFDKNIIDPIARFITPTIHAIPQIAAIIPRKINEHFQNSRFKKNIDEFFKNHITTPLQKVTEKILTPIAKTATSIITSPVRLLGFVGDKIRARQIKTGNADYMTARERNEWMIEHRKGEQISAVDKLLADIGTKGGMDVKDADQLSKNIGSIYTNKSELAYSRKKQEKKINDIINKTAVGKLLSSKAKGELRKAIETGNMNKVRTVLSTYATEGGTSGLTEEQIKSLLDGEGLGNEIKQYMNIKDKEKLINNMTDSDREKIEDELGGFLDKLGIGRDKLKNKHFMTKFAKNLETEVLNREANKTGKDEIALETENNELFKKMAVSLQDIRNAIIAISTGNNKELEKMGIHHDEDYDKAIKDMEKDFDFRRKDNVGYIGEDLYNKFDDKVKSNLSAYSKGVFQKNKATKANKNRVLIKRYNMTAEEVNACKGDVERLSDIIKIGYRVDPSAIPMLNAFTETQLKIVTKFIKEKYIKEILKNRPLTKDDFNFALYNNPKLANNKCEWVIKHQGFDPKHFKSIEEVMAFEGDRKGEGLEQNPQESFSQKFGRKIKNAAKFIFSGANGFDSSKDKNESVNEETPKDEGQQVTPNAFGTISFTDTGIPIIPQNGIGTTLLDLGGSALKGLFNVGKNIVGKISSRSKSLFNKEKDDSNKAGVLASLLGAGKNLFNNHAGNSTGSMDEVDKSGDGKDLVHIGDGKFIHVERDSSGNIEPDTSDSGTKKVMNELSLKEKANEAFQAAQMKTFEVLRNTFDTSKIKESKNGKFGWFSLLLGGAVLWKSGIIQKLFNGFIKPLWADHVKPWIDNTAVPWIKDMWTNKVEPFIIDTVLPKAGELFGAAINTLIKALPGIIKGAIKGLFKIGDTATGNKYNAGGSTTIDPTKILEDNDYSALTGMTDENGNQLTIGDLQNNNFTKIYNAEGIEGTVNEDGTISFKDQSLAGTSYTNTIINAGSHQFAKSLATGKEAGLGVKLATKINKGLKKGGFVSKILGYTGDMLIKPISASGSAGAKTNTWLYNTIDNIADESLDKATKNTAKNAAKNSDDLPKILNLAKRGLNALFGDTKVYKKLSDVATSLGQKAPAKWIKSFKTYIDDIIEKGLKESIEKVGAETVKKVASKVLFIAFLVIDFMYGCDNAESILGVNETNIAEELVAGLVNMLGNLIIIPSLLPPDCPCSIQWIARKIYEFFDDSLEERQAEATEEYNKYVEETGSTLTKEEYLSRNYAVTGKIGGWLVDTDFFNKARNVLNPVGSIAGAKLDKLTENSDNKLSKFYRNNSDVIKNGINMITNPFVTLGTSLWPALIGNKEKFTNNSNETSVPANANGTLSLSESETNTGLINYTSDKYIQGINNLLSENLSLDNLGLNRDIAFTDLNKTMKKVELGEISIFSKDYWKQSIKSDGTFKNTLENAYSTLSKIINFPVLMVAESLEGLSSYISKISGSTVNLNSSHSTSSKTSSLRSKKSSVVNKIKSAFSNGVSKIINFFGGFGTGNYEYGTGSYSKQIDPSVADIRFNSSSDSEYQTIGDSGCGPVAAVNVLESMYGRGNAITSAAKFAIDRKYKEINGGTKPKFFSDYFNINGLNSQTSYDKSSIERNINSGLPTVIMGQNPNGVSSYSPFGKTPHYVTVTGTDGNGNAIVQDPESRYDNQLYPVKSLMKNTSLGVSAFGKGNGKWGRGNEEQVWWYLTQVMGMTDAGAAGMLGNIKHESGVKFNNVEDILESKIGYNDESYTKAIDNGTIDKATFLNPTPGSQYGYGLVQWTSPSRKEGLYDLAKSKNTSIADPATQLEWLGNELANNYSGVLETLKTTKSVSDASTKVLGEFEIPANWQNQIGSRSNESRNYYNKFKGTTGEEIVGALAPGQIANSNSSSLISNNNSNSTNIFSMISNTLGDFLNNTKAGKAFNAFTSGISDVAVALLGGTPNTNTNNISSSVLSGSYGPVNCNAAAFANKALEYVGNGPTAFRTWFYGSDQMGIPWCAIFVSYVANQVGALDKIIIKTAGAGEFARQGVKAGWGKWYEGGSIPQVGDIITFTWNGQGRYSGQDAYYSDHVGIVYNVDNDKVYTVEGNSGNNNDTSTVRKREYSLNSGNINGYYRPNWSSSSSKSTSTGKGENGYKPLSKYGQIKNSTYSKEFNSIYHKTNNTYTKAQKTTLPIQRVSGKGENGYKPLSKYGQFRDSISGKGSNSVYYKTNNSNTKSQRIIVPREENIINSTNSSHSYSKSNRSANNTMSFGMGASRDYSKLINSIITILMTIADNTDKLNTIVSILNDKLNLNISASDVSNATTGTQSLKSKLSNALNGINNISNFNTYANSIEDPSINSIILAMNAIASE